MGVFLLILGLMIVSAPLWVLVTYKTKEPVNIFSLIIVVCFSALVVISIFAAVVAISQPVSYEKKWNERESLVETYEFYQENVGKDIYHDKTYQELTEKIANFNTNLVKAKIFKNNPWTNWFYCDYSGIEKIEFVSSSA